MRNYKTEPIIWGDNHCEHEWSDTPPRRNRKASDIKDLTSKEATNAGNVGIELPVTDTCLKCNAWRGELGLEPTPQLYIEHLMLIFNEVKRVLKRSGTCWVNIDDSYGGSGSPGGDFRNGKGGDDYLRPYDRQNVPAKSLCLIPERFAMAMVENGWILRNRIAWVKQSPMPESMKDRFTGSWEYLFFFVKSRKYWFEQQFERYSPVTLQDRRITRGRNKRDVWIINTEPYVAHFATFPEKLCETPILAGCPAAICKKCGKARQKVYGDSEWERHQSIGMAALDTPNSPMYRGGHHNEGLPYRGSIKDKGYTDCDCEPKEYEPGVVLDPFTGSGTAQAVAKKLGRKSIGIELNPEYCDLAAKRLREIPMSLIAVSS